MTKTNPEFEEFTDFMDKLAKVPHEELKKKLEDEKKDKEQAKLPQQKTTH